MGQRPANMTFCVVEWRKVIARCLAVFALLVLMLPDVGRASDARFITWDALVPANTTGGDALGLASVPGGTGAQQEGHLSKSSVDTSGPAVVGAQSGKDRVASGHDVSPVVLQQRVLIDGYVLPLAWEGIRVVDFLLVPWVGACIHMPTPPPNQIIHVSYPQGLVLEKQFEAVRLAGILEHVAANHDLYLVDGQRRISVSYALKDAKTAGSPGAIIAMSADDLPWLAKLQIRVNDLFTDSMRAIANDRSSKALIFALLISFGYGALHTLGPGHGKSVVISYFVGTGGSLRRGLTMGVKIAVFHVLSAIVVVSLLDLAVRQMTGAAPSDYRAIRLGSYALIVVIGAVMLWQAVSALLARRTDVAGRGSAHTHDHSLHHMQNGCSACAVAASGRRGGGWIAASVGIVPCTGALLVMLFGLANDLVWPAFLMVVSISAGMALAMSAIGVIALYGRQFAEKRFAGDIGRSADFDIAARILGAACVLAVGTLLFLLTLSYPPVFQAPVTGLSAS